MPEPVTIGVFCTAVLSFFNFLFHSYQVSRSTCLYHTCCCNGEVSLEPSRNNSRVESLNNNQTPTNNLNQNDLLSPSPRYQQGNEKVEKGYQSLQEDRDKKKSRKNPKKG